MYHELSPPIKSTVQYSTAHLSTVLNIPNNATSLNTKATTKHKQVLNVFNPILIKS